MAAVTVGVPVYNGADLLDECLHSLSQQTFTDFEVLVVDNASTDSTGDIGRAWAARDRRFSYFRQDENVGLVRNFITALNAARSEHFAWRAHDDLSASNFLEVTHRLLEASPKAKLAVCTVVSEELESGHRRVRLVPDTRSGPRAMRLARLMLATQPNWFHGLWKRQHLSQTFEPLWKRYPSDWGIDQLAVYGVLVEDAVVGTNETIFTKRLDGIEKRRRRVRAASFAEMIERRRDFSAECSRLLDQAPLSLVERAVLTVPTLLYANKRAYTLRRVARAWLRGRNSEADGSSPSSTISPSGP